MLEKTWISPIYLLVSYDDIVSYRMPDEAAPNEDPHRHKTQF